MARKQMLGGATFEVAPGQASDNLFGPTVAVFCVVVFFFGFGGVWANIARLDQAAVAPGVVASEGNIKAIQHLEGGIVRQVFVRDGDKVQSGQPLVRLESLAARATSESTSAQLTSALAKEARLVAERDELPSIVFPPEFDSRGDQVQIQAARSDQIQQFRDRRTALIGQINILHAKIAQIEEEMSGSGQLRDSAAAQIDKIDQELLGLRELAQKKLIPVARVFAMEREKARLSGEIGRADADISRAEQSKNETMLTIDQTRKQFIESVGRDLVDVRKEIVSLRERAAIAADVLARVDVTSPIDGIVQGLKVFTAGGVVKAGETMMEVAPTTDRLVVRARVTPNDIDSVSVGQSAEISFPAFASRKPPIFLGSVKSLSRDRLQDDTNKEPYFLAEVEADLKLFPGEFASRVVPGMQADAIISTGERTAWQYLWGPVRERLKRSMHER